MPSRHQSPAPTRGLESDPPSLSRRRFLRTAGLGTVGAAAVAGGGSYVVAGLADRAFVEAAPPDPARFGRIFDDLPAFAEPSDALAAALIDLGRPGGPMDARDDLGAGPAALITDLALGRRNRDNPTEKAGTTFLGQFIDHDITRDLTSRLGVPAEPAQTANRRTPTLDLDSLYGGGPTGSPELYDPEDRVKLRIESGGQFEDLPRDRAGNAIIAEPRNDENLMIAGLHAAFILFHNAVVDHLRAGAPPVAPTRDARRGNRRRRPDGRRGAAPDLELFGEARRTVVWHYHWIVVHHFLPEVIGEPLVDDIVRNGRRFYLPRRSPYMPVEFQGAAYRFGHSLVRPSYRANLAGDGGEPFFGMVFDPAGQGQADPVDLRGGARAPRRFIGWQTFFDFGDGEVKPNKHIDTTLSTPLFDLPLGTIADGQPPTSLATRNLLRQVTWMLPSGQALARRMEVPPLGAGDLDDLRAYGLGLERSTPLWFYVLREAQRQGSGSVLGGVGGRIVGEVLLGLMQADRDSYLAVEPAWRPTLPARSGRTTGEFDVPDLLTFAGVDPASRGQ